VKRPPLDEDTFLRFFRTLDERQARLCAAERALAIGRGGITLVSRVTGLSYPTIHKGITELRNTAATLTTGRIRRPGGGRKKVEVVDPAVLPILQQVVESSTAGSPMDVLRWTSKSKTKLAEALAERGHRLAPNTVGRLLHEQARAFLDRSQPVISVDAKKKELVGDFKNAGRTWQPKGQPVRVQVHDFPSMSSGKAVPYGIYDVAHNCGFVNVGTSHDTPDFAVESIRLWWEQEGRIRYPLADSLLVLADSGGSNSARSRLWKVRLQELADTLHLRITVCHLPPGTSKWNKIEHRLFAYISIHWRGRPLIDFETIVSLIGTTSTTTGLKVTAKLDLDAYPTGVKVPNQVMDQLNLEPHTLHPQWNYTLAPRPA